MDQGALIEIEGMEPCSCDEDVAYGVLAGLGFDASALEKALVPTSPPLGPDPRFPALHKLVTLALTFWRDHQDSVLAAVQRMLAGGDLLPFTPSRERSWRLALRDVRRGFLLRLAGFDPEAGSDPVEPVDPSMVALAWRAGRSRDPMNPLGRNPERELHEARALQLTATDEAALEYVQRRAGSYITVPSNALVEVANRAILDEHFHQLGAAISGGLDPKQTHARIGQAVAEAFAGTPLNNDVERIVRTELCFAQGDGAKVALKAAASAAGMPDPWVWKAVRKGACAHCRRIWGAPGSPKRYRLSEVDARDKAGGNVGLPAVDWGPVSGPVHPNCTEGPLQLHDAKVLDAVQAAMARFQL